MLSGSCFLSSSDTGNIEWATALPAFLLRQSKHRCLAWNLFVSSLSTIFSLFSSSEGAAFARMIISCTVEYKELTICTVYGQTMFMKQICILTVNCAADYKQLTICTVYSVQLGPNPVHETNLHLNCKVCSWLQTADHCTLYSVQLRQNTVHETNLHLNCKVLGLFRAKVWTEKTHNLKKLD